MFRAWRTGAAQAECVDGCSVCRGPGTWSLLREHESPHFRPQHPTLTRHLDLGLGPHGPGRVDGDLHVIGATVTGLGMTQQHGAIGEADNVTLLHGTAISLGSLQLRDIGEQPCAAIGLLPQVPDEVLEGVWDALDRQQKVLVLLRLFWNLLDVEGCPGAAGDPEGQDQGCGESQVLVRDHSALLPIGPHLGVKKCECCSLEIVLELISDVRPGSGVGT